MPIIADASTAEIAIRRIIEAENEAARRATVEGCLRRIDADDLFAALKAAADQYFAINGAISLRIATALRDATDLAGRLEMRPVALMSQADALRSLGKYRESVRLYEEAQRAFLAQGDEVGWARIHTGWIYSMHFLGRGVEALARVGPAHDVLVRHGQRLYAARLDLNTAIVRSWLGHYDDAMRHYDRALAAFDSLGEVAEEAAARTRMHQAEILALRGDFPAALALHAEARRTFVRRGTTADAARQTLAIGDIHASQGEYTPALRLYTDAFAELDAAGHREDAAWAALRVVACYLSLNRNEEAMEVAGDAGARFDECGALAGVAKVHVALAIAHARTGDPERALALLDEAVGIFGRAGLDTDLAMTSLQRAGLRIEEGAWTAALDDAADAGAFFRDRGLIAGQAQADVMGAWARFELGNTREAARIAEMVRRDARRRGMPWLAPEASHLIARIARAEGRYADALAECQTAIAAIERVQGNLALALRGNFLADKLQVYHDAMDCCLRLGEPRWAFALLERAKSRALVDYLEGHPDIRPQSRAGEDQGLIDELHRLRGEHDWFYSRLYGDHLLQRPDDPPAAAIDALASMIRDRERRIARILERLALRGASGGEGIAAALGDPLGEGPPMPVLDPDTVLLEYYFHGRDGMVFVATSEHLAVVPLDTSAGKVREMLDRWYLNLDATAAVHAAGAPLVGLARNARSILGALYRMLIAPVDAALGEAGCAHLVVVPFGPTHAVPFHALHDGHQHLIERMAITLCPSSGVLRLCEARARQPHRATGALVVAHSDGGRLPFVCEEARGIAALFPGTRLLEEEATRDALAEAVPNHRIVHLAAHGEARLDNPTFAHLRLADGRLLPSDVFNLRLDGALVTLSGCETGRGVVTGGDEVGGLSRGFLHAGAETVVQSLWRVDDDSTARLMARFYRALRDGGDRSAALREAQLAQLADTDGGTHPYFWAPFQLIGAGGPLEIGG